MRLYGSLKRYSVQLRKGEALKLSLNRGATLQNLYRRMKIPVDDIKIVLVNGRSQNKDYLISDGDRIALFPPIAGG